MSGPVSTAAGTLDHAAFPCFDVEATHRFYADALGLELVHAQRGPAEVWNAREYLLLAYRLPGGGALDFFAFDGIARPAPDGLPTDIRHVAVTLASRNDVRALEARLDERGIAFWTESHGAGDVHLYVTDPNGVVLELLATQDGTGSREHDPAGARAVLDGWTADHAAAGSPAR